MPRASTQRPSEGSRARSKRKPAGLRPGRTLDGRWIDWSEAFRMLRDGVPSEEIAAHFGVALEKLHVGLHTRRVRLRETLKVERARDVKLNRVWQHSRAKCYNPKHRSFATFGGKGIGMCPEWRASFNAFRAWALANGCRPGLRLARKRRDRDFGPENCEWVTTREADRRLRDGPRGSAGKGKPRPVIDWDEVQRLYAEEGLDRRAIAERVGAHPNTITAGLRRHGALRRRGTGPSSRPEWRPLKATWYHMHARAKAHARGHRVAREWKAFEPFFEWALASGWKRGRCLYRIDRRKPYGPGNCEWLTRGKFSGRARHSRGRPRAPRVPITAFGETKGLLAWAADPRCTITNSALKARLRAGMDPETAITLPPSNRTGRRRLVRAFGERKTAGEWARDPRCSICADSLRKRLRSGMPAEEAITAPPRRRSPGPVVYLFTAMRATKSVSDWCLDRRCMVNHETLRSRLKDGWIPEDAIRTPPFEVPLSHRVPRRPKGRGKAARKA